MQQRSFEKNENIILSKKQRTTAARPFSGHNPIVLYLYYHLPKRPTECSRNCFPFCFFSAGFFKPAVGLKINAAPDRSCPAAALGILLRIFSVPVSRSPLPLRNLQEISFPAVPKIFLYPNRSSLQQNCFYQNAAKTVSVWPFAEFSGQNILPGYPLLVAESA